MINKKRLSALTLSIIGTPLLITTLMTSNGLAAENANCDANTGTDSTTIDINDNIHTLNLLELNATCSGGLGVCGETKYPIYINLMPEFKGTKEERDQVEVNFSRVYEDKKCGDAYDTYLKYGQTQSTPETDQSMEAAWNTFVECSEKAPIEAKKITDILLRTDETDENDCVRIQGIGFSIGDITLYSKTIFQGCTSIETPVSGMTVIPTGQCIEVIETSSDITVTDCENPYAAIPSFK